MAEIYLSAEVFNPALCGSCPAQNLIFDECTGGSGAMVRSYRCSHLELCQSLLPYVERELPRAERRGCCD